MTQINCAIFPLRSFSILHRVFASVVRNCLFTYVRTFLLFGIIYVLVWLCYFFQSFCWSLHCFILANESYLYSLFWQVLADAVSSSLAGFCHFACILLFQMLVFVMLLPSLAFCRVFVLFWFVCDQFYSVILLGGFVFGWYICGLVLLFRLLISFLSCLCMTSIHCLNRSPLLLPICSSRSSSLYTTIICVSIVRVLSYPYFAKHVLCVHFRLFLSRFPFHPVNLYPIAPIRINYYSFTLIFDHSAQNPHNIMSGEVSPAIGHKSWPIRP